jgi:hypothetical protein
MSHEPLPVLDPDAYERTIQTRNYDSILGAFVGQILAFRGAMNAERVPVLAQVMIPDFYSGVFTAIDACILDRLMFPAEQSLPLDGSTLMHYYMTQWPGKDARDILCGVCNALYRVIGVSLQGYLGLYSKLYPDADPALFAALRSVLAEVMQVFTSTQCFIQNKPGYIEGPYPDAC